MTMENNTSQSLEDFCNEAESQLESLSGVRIEQSLYFIASKIKEVYMNSDNPPTDKEIAQEAIMVYNHVLTGLSLVSPSDEQLECVDGRGDNASAKHVGGADLGILVAMVANGMSVADAIDKLKKNFNILNIHTDEHHDGPAAGCGYWGLVKDFPAKYGLNEGQVEKINDWLMSHAEDYNEVVLPGDHEEFAIFVNKSETFGLPPANEQTGTHAFVSDRARTAKLIRSLFPDDPDKAKAVIERLLRDEQTTLEGLESSQGKIIYEVTGDVGENGNVVLSINPIGRVSMPGESPLPRPGSK